MNQNKRYSIDPHDDPANSPCPIGDDHPDKVFAADRAPSAERLLEIARATGLRSFLHGVNATNAREIIAKYVDAVLEDMATSSAGSEGGQNTQSDKELLDWLERRATTGFSFDLATITFPVPEQFEGTNTLRDLVRSAMTHADSEESDD